MEDGQLSATIREALRLRAAMKIDGATRDELDAALEQTLRVAWPQRRTWTYVCELCGDTGWVTRICRAFDRCPGWSSVRPDVRAASGRYRQRQCAIEPSYEHEFVEPCFCGKGQGMRSQLQQTPLFDAPKKPRKLTRVGG